MARQRHRRQGSVRYGEVGPEAGPQAVGPGRQAMRAKRYLRLALGAVLLVVLTAAECSRFSGRDRQAANEAGGEEAAAAPARTAFTLGARVVNAEAEPLVPSTFVQYIRVVGEVEALRDVTVSAEESGTIASFLAGKGERVARGQPVTRISSELLDAQVEEARAIAEVAAERFERQRRLWDQRIGTEIALLEVKSQATSSAARLKVLETRLARTVVTSPITGIFDEQYVEVGELVGPGTRLLRVLTIDRVKVVAGIPERYALAIEPGAAALITFDVLEGREFSGVIEFVGTSVDPRSRTIPIEVILDNSERLIRPRMVANVQVERMRQEQVIVVPQDLVQRTEDGFQVFVAERSGDAVTARARSVELGASYANQVVISAGLTAGERLITAGHRQVDDGSVIRLMER